MPTPSWFNENSNRAYPFLLGTVHKPLGPTTLGLLSNDVIVDAGFVIGGDAGFDAAQHQVFLKQVRRAGSSFYFDFATTAPLMTGALLTFTRTLGGQHYQTEEVDSLASTPASASAEACDEPLWNGFMVSGTLDSLAALMPADGTLLAAAGECLIESAVIQNLSGALVRAFVLANADRTRVTAPPNCPAEVWPYPIDVIHIGPHCLQGALLLVSGFNCTLRQDEFENSVTITAAAGAGAGQPCANVPLFSTEVPPTGSVLLEGGPQCNETVRSLNGIGGSMFDFLAGTGVSITPKPDAHVVVINIDFSGLLVCPPGSIGSVSESF